VLPLALGWRRGLAGQSGAPAVLVACRHEKQQVELRERFRSEGLECKALLS
jgi:hypothetical protein